MVKLKNQCIAHLDNPAGRFGRGENLFPGPIQYGRIQGRIVLGHRWSGTDGRFICTITLCKLAFMISMCAVGNYLVRA